MVNSAVNPQAFVPFFDVFEEVFALSPGLNTILLPDPNRTLIVVSATAGTGCALSTRRISAATQGMPVNVGDVPFVMPFHIFASALGREWFAFANIAGTTIHVFSETLRYKR